MYTRYQYVIASRTMPPREQPTKHIALPQGGVGCEYASEINEKEGSHDKKTRQPE